MPVKNIGAIGPSGNVKPIPVITLIPPAFDPIKKIELIDSSDVAYDISDIIMKDSTYTDGVTDNVGSFDIKILDPNKDYSGAINSFNYVKIYLDYGVTATTLRFKGVIETAKREENIYFRITGRSEGGVIVSGKNIIYSASAKSRSDVIKEILTEYFPTINQDNIEEDTTEITVNYNEVNFQKIIEELCGSHHDFYIDSGLNAKYFEKNSITNTTEAISEGVNLVSAEGYGQDSEETYTKTRVYGAKQGDIALFATSDSDTSNTNGIVKENNITDLSVYTTQQATELADYNHTSSVNISNLGGIQTLILPSLAPGELLYIASPSNNLDPGYYNINSFTHDLVSLKTGLTISKKNLDVAKIIKSNIVSTSDISENDNPYDMDFSKIITFDEDSGTHSNTEINEGYLKVSAGSSTGQWISDIYTLDTDVSTVSFKMTGDNLTKQYGATTSNLWFSLNGGATWTLFAAGSSTIVPTGRDLRLRIDLNSSDAQVLAAAFFYKKSS